MENNFDLIAAVLMFLFGVYTGLHAFNLVRFDKGLAKLQANYPAFFKVLSVLLVAYSIFRIVSRL